MYTGTSSNITTMIHNKGQCSAVNVPVASYQSDNITIDFYLVSSNSIINQQNQSIIGKIYNRQKHLHQSISDNSKNKEGHWTPACKLFKLIKILVFFVRIKIIN